MKGASVPLRRELLVSFGVLFGAAMLLAVLGVTLLLPVLAPRQATLFLAMLIVLDLAVVFAFGSYLLRQKLVVPVEAILADVDRIVSAEYDHRVRPMASAEFQKISESVNALADRLVREQQLLSDNVRSLEETNAQLLEARNELVRAARMASVGSLAAGIAHEVGNPLGAIMGYVDLARGRAAREGGDPALLDAVRDEAGRIDSIVRGLLDYARPRDARARLVAPATVLERVRDLLLAQGKLDGVQHVWRFEEDSPLVMLEAARLEQVTVNLLLNAVDALEEVEDGRLEVSLTSEEGPTGRLTPRRENDPEGINYLHRRRAFSPDGKESLDLLGVADWVVLIEVSDNGSGIPGEDLDRVFDPFYTTKAPGRGTGLGLSICARLVEGMGGVVDVHNASDRGAVFTIRPPAARSGDAGEPEAAAAQPVERTKAS